MITGIGMLVFGIVALMGIFAAYIKGYAEGVRDARRQHMFEMQHVSHRSKN